MDTIERRQTIVLQNADIYFSIQFIKPSQLLSDVNHKQSFYRARKKRDFSRVLELHGNHSLDAECRIPKQVRSIKRVELDTTFCNIDFRFYQMADKDIRALNNGERGEGCLLLSVACRADSIFRKEEQRHLPSIFHTSLGRKPHQLFSLYYFGKSTQNLGFHFLIKINFRTRLKKRQEKRRRHNNELLCSALRCLVMM